MSIGQAIRMWIGLQKPISNVYMKAIKENNGKTKDSNTRTK
jgi:hypothetical protein